MTTNAITRCPQAPEAIGALLDFLQNNDTAVVASETAALFGDAAKRMRWINCDLTFLLTPRPHRVPLLFTLPHSIHEESSICVVTPAPQRKFKDIMLALDPPMTNVKKIIDYKKLEAKFSEPVALRGLAKAFDAFFVHGDLQHFPKLLTGEFLTHRTPVWMPKAKTFPESIRLAASTVVVPRRGASFISVPIGHSQMTPVHILENFYSLLDQLVQWLSNDWRDLQQVSLSITTRGGKLASLPVYAHDFAESHPGVFSGAATAQPTATGGSSSPTPAARKSGRSSTTPATATATTPSERTNKKASPAKSASKQPRPVAANEAEEPARKRARK